MQITYDLGTYIAAVKAGCSSQGYNTYRRDTKVIKACFEAKMPVSAAIKQVLKN